MTYSKGSFKALGSCEIVVAPFVTLYLILSRLFHHASLKFAKRAQAGGFDSRYRATLTVTDCHSLQQIAVSEVKFGTITRIVVPVTWYSYTDLVYFNSSHKQDLTCMSTFRKFLEGSSAQMGAGENPFYCKNQGIEMIVYITYH